jgi:hypothetical protein
MTRRILGSTCAAAVLAASVAAAQGSSQAPTSAPAQGSGQQRPADRGTTTATPRTQTEQQLTLTGCVTRESNDIVLASAVPSGPATNSSSGVTGSTSTAAIGTSGSASGSAVGTTGTGSSRYRLSGERDLDQYIGQRVEIVGRMDPDAAAKSPSGTTDLGTPGLGPQRGSGVGTPANGGVGTRDNSGVGSPSSSGVGSPSPTSSTGSVTPGAGTSAAGATSDSTPGPTGSLSTPRSAAAQTSAMPHLTITSVRALGGTCESPGR